MIQVDIECAISTDANVLISGGDSAARTALARLIHEHSRKRQGLMLVVGSQAIIQATPEFDAAPDAADRTIFIEELAALDEPAQAELMRLIDGAEPVPHGARATRVISGTAHNLTGRMASNLFSAELFYRLNIIHIALDDERRLAKPSTVH